MAGRSRLLCFLGHLLKLAVPLPPGQREPAQGVQEQRGHLPAQHQEAQGGRVLIGEGTGVWWYTNRRGLWDACGWRKGKAGRLGRVWARVGRQGHETMGHGVDQSVGGVSKRGVRRGLLLRGVAVGMCGWRVRSLESRLDVAVGSWKVGVAEVKTGKQAGTCCAIPVLG